MVANNKSTPVNLLIELRHKGETYTVLDDYDWPNLDQARYEWMWGNHACDCNRSRVIATQCDGDIKELPCGQDAIVLMKIRPMTKEEAERYKLHRLITEYRELALSAYDYSDCIADGIEKAFHSLDEEAKNLGLAGIEPLPIGAYRKLAEEY